MTQNKLNLIRQAWEGRGSAEASPDFQANVMQQLNLQIDERRSFKLFFIKCVAVMLISLTAIPLVYYFNFQVQPSHENLEQWYSDDKENYYFE